MSTIDYIKSSAYLETWHCVFWLWNLNECCKLSTTSMSQGQVFWGFGSPWGYLPIRLDWIVWAHSKSFFSCCHLVGPRQWTFSEAHLSFGIASPWIAGDPYSPCFLKDIGSGVEGNPAFVVLRWNCCGPLWFKSGFYFFYLYNLLS